MIFSIIINVTFTPEILDSSQYNMTDFIKNIMSYFWAQQHTPGNMPDTDINTLAQIPGLLAFHAAMNTDTSSTTIVGGSFGLRLFTQRKFDCSDIDIVSSAIEASGYKSLTNEMILVTEAQMLREIYGLNVEIVIKHRSDLNLVDENGEVISPVSGMPAVEDFDEYIIGTVNVGVTPKIQYVFVNQPESQLQTWYKQVSDLPVYCTIGPETDVNFQFRNFDAAEKAKIHGILSGIKHEYRKDKYRAKGFVVE